MKFSWITLLLSLFFTACAYEAGEKYFIKNDSDYPLDILYSNYKSSIRDTASPGRKLLIFQNYYRGHAFDKGEDFLEIFDTLSICINDTLFLNKNYRVRREWDYEVTYFSDKYADGGTSEYTLSVSNKDIEIMNY